MKKFSRMLVEQVTGTESAEEVMKMSPRNRARHARVCSQEHLARHVNDRSHLARIGAVANKHVTAEHLHDALKSTHPHVTRAVLDHPKAGKAHVEQALSHKSDDVVGAAVWHDKTTQTQLRHVQDNHKSPNVRLEAGFKLGDHRSLTGILHDKSPDVVGRAALHPKATKDTHNELASHSDHRVTHRYALTMLYNGKKVPKKALEHLKNHPNEDVRRTADTITRRFDRLRHGRSGAMDKES